MNVFDNGIYPQLMAICIGKINEHGDQTIGARVHTILRTNPYIMHVCIYIYICTHYMYIK